MSVGVQQAATAEDIAAALRSDDPVAVVREQLAALDTLESWVLDEQAKWQHVLALVESPDA